MSVLEGKVLIAQGGGPTAVINQSLAGVVLESRKFPQVTRVYGAVHGVDGIVNENFLDLTQETTHNLERVAQTTSSALLSTRTKPDEDFCARMFDVMKAHDIRYFFYIGGNDSADTVRIINEQAETENYEFRSIHIPKTIDNDLVLNDHTPGYPSAARFVAQAFMGVNLDNRSIPGIYIGVVMGRHAGFLTAASVLGQTHPEDGPHLVYVPERPFDTKLFLDDVENTLSRHGRCVIAASEGIADENEVPIAQKLVESVERDAHGNVQLSGSGVLGDMLANLIKGHLKTKRVRADTLGYLQRSFAGVVSDVDQNEAREIGERAAHLAIWHNLDGSVTINRTGSYSVDYRLVSLADIAAKTRVMPNNFISKKGNGVTDAFRAYLRPLLGSRFPSTYRLRAPLVKKLRTKS
ncbi:MAG: 6-phosphofructokinase [Deltaproteobacteria bacterium]|nr:6-phosphofructokinase [Deltaproteobacteria bacterium]